MKPWWPTSAATLLLTAALSGAAPAHQGIEHQLQRLQQTGQNLPDLLRRADLHRRNGDWTRALADYRQAAALDPDHPHVAVGRAQTHLDRGEPQAALPPLDTLLRHIPKYAPARLLQARALRALGRHNEAAAAFATALRQLAAPTPDHYLDYAEVLLAADNGVPTRALAALDQGATRLHHPPSLHARALALERAAGARQAALSRVRALLARDPRPLDWRLAEAELLLESGRAAAARRALSALLARIDALPPARRASRAVVAIADRSRDHLATLDGRSKR